MLEYFVSHHEEGVDRKALKSMGETVSLLGSYSPIILIQSGG